MMVVVATNDQPREQPITPSEIVPAEGAAPPPATRPPANITPEEIRQFQEFQRFQELMRDQAEKGFPQGTPPPPGFLQPWGQPPPKESFGKRLLKATISKIITGLVVLAVLVIAGYLAIDYFLGEEHNQPKASEVGGGETETNVILPEDPYEAVRMIYHQIANGKGVPAQVCLRFKDGGKKFATDMGYDNCTEAVKGLAPQVTNANDYAESMPSYKTTFNPATHNEVRISSCADNIRGGIQGGPALGVFTVEKDLDSKPGPKGGKQWVIVGHENEPPCTTTSTGPSN